MYNWVTRKGKIESIPGVNLCWFDKIKELEELIKVVMDENGALQTRIEILINKQRKLKTRTENLEAVITDMMPRDPQEALLRSKLRQMKLVNEIKELNKKQSKIVTLCDDCPCNINNRFGLEPECTLGYKNKISFKSDLGINMGDDNNLFVSWSKECEMEYIRYVKDHRTYKHFPKRMIRRK